MVVPYDLENKPWLLVASKTISDKEMTEMRQRNEYENCDWLLGKVKLG